MPILNVWRRCGWAGNARDTNISTSATMECVSKGNASRGYSDKCKRRHCQACEVRKFGTIRYSFQMNLFFSMCCAFWNIDTAAMSPLQYSLLDSWKRNVLVPTYPHFCWQQPIIKVLYAARGRERPRDPTHFNFRFSNSFACVFC